MDKMDKTSADKVRRIIETYAGKPVPAETERDFAAWFADPRHSEEKDNALAGLWSSFSLGKAADLNPALLRMKTRLGHPLPQKKRLRRWIPRVAAVLIPAAVILTTVLLTLRPSSEPSVYLSLQAADTILYQKLPDSSAVWLNSGGTLIYTETADGSRRAELRGEAFFDVARRAGSVFEVQVPDLTVRVLGTQFNVREDAAMTEVMLYEGSVEVSLSDGSVPLTPGMMLTYRDGEVRTGDIPKDHINWRYAILDFKGDDIAFILRRVGLYWGVALELPGTELPADPLTIRFDGNETLDHMMFLLQELSGGFDYALEGDRMTITRR